MTFPRSFYVGWRRGSNTVIYRHLPDEHIGSGLFDDENGAAEARQTIEMNSR
jgi:hypothetical protein